MTLTSTRVTGAVSAWQPPPPPPPPSRGLPWALDMFG
jgi:hypothetical protein